jgi:hypothetical protein
MSYLIPPPVGILPPQRMKEMFVISYLVYQRSPNNPFKPTRVAVALNLNYIKNKVNYEITSTKS